MKRLLFFAAFLLAVVQVWSGNVDLTTARTKATDFLKYKATAGRLTASSPSVIWTHEVKNSTNAMLTAFYIVNTDKGFVVVAGDDRAQEILAYGDGTLEDINILPENMRFWLNSYQAQMEYLQANPDLKVEKTVLGSSRSVSVEPMLEAMWTQGYPYYNQCPMDGDRRRQVVPPLPWHRCSTSGNIPHSPHL